MSWETLLLGDVYFKENKEYEDVSLHDLN